jgi:hypothetical protein
MKNFTLCAPVIKPLSRGRFCLWKKVFPGDTIGPSREKQISQEVNIMYYSAGTYESFAHPEKPEGVDNKSAPVSPV